MTDASRGMVTPLRVQMADVQPTGSGLVSLRGVNPLSPLVRPYTSSSIRAGHHGTDVAKALSVHLSSYSSLPEVLTRVCQDTVHLLLLAPFWPA